MGTLISKVKELFASVKEDKTKSNFVGMFVLGVVNIATSLILKYVIGFKFSLLTGISDLFSTLFGTGTTQSTQEPEPQEEDLTDKFAVKVLYDSRKEHAVARVLVMKKPENWSVNKIKWVEVHDETETPAENTEITYITPEDPVWTTARYDFDAMGIGEVLGFINFEVEPIVPAAKDYKLVFKQTDSEREYEVSFTLPIAPLSDPSEFVVSLYKSTNGKINGIECARPKHWRLNSVTWVYIENGVEVQKVYTPENTNFIILEYTGQTVVDIRFQNFTLDTRNSFELHFREFNIKRTLTVSAVFPPESEDEGEDEGE